MRYYQRAWADGESGPEEWYFEVAPDGTVTRQMELRTDGTAFKYHPDHLEDTPGFLTDQPIDHAEFAEYGISPETFERAWIAHPGINEA